MQPPNHLARWIAAGVSVLALSGVGTAAATTEPPDDTAMETGDTSMGTDDTSMAGAEGAGPSDCPAITVDDMAPETSAAAVETAGDDAAAATDVATTEESMMTDTSAPSDITGDTMVDVSAPPMDGPAIQIVETDEFGPILVDGACFTLYGFTPDADAGGEPTCVDDCAAMWPPAFVADVVPPLADELDPSLFSVVEHVEGPMLKVGDWPLYYFAPDTEPGDINGQGVGGVWWVVSPDGTLIEDAVDAGDGTEAADSLPASETAVTSADTTEG